MPEPFHSLSDDLTTEILIRLPAKSLFKFKSVCKRWRDLISEQCFIKSFITNSKSLPPLTGGFFYNDSVTKQVNFFDFNSQIVNHNDYIVDRNLTFVNKYSIEVLASHNGILLCFSKNPRHYFVCNPVRKQWLNLPELEGEFGSFPLFVCYSKGDSFGFKIEFKLVFFREIRQNEIYVDTFCSETRERKSSILSHNLGIFSVFDHYVLLDGSAYLWSGNRLCAFDVIKETLRSVELPASGCYHNCFSVSAGSLYFAASTFEDIRIWVLVDGVEWFLKHSVEYDALNPRYFFCAFAFHPILSELVLMRSVFVEQRRIQAFSYCTKTGTLELISEEDPKDCFGKVFPYLLPAWMPCL